MIIIRATVLTERTRAFGESIADASGMDLAFLLDGRHPVEIHTDRPKLMLTRQACEALGLYCPHNYAWRCGDYGFYLARKAFPAVAAFWLIENDVRFAGGPVEPFFRHFESEPADMLAMHLRKAGPDWSWYTFAAARDVTTHRCLFPVVRLSAPALDVLLEKRAAQAKRRQRRATWPNDEGFVATTLAASNLDCRDINSFGVEFYNAETFRFGRPADGDCFAPETGRLMVYHPVHYADDHTRSSRRAGRPHATVLSRVEQRVRRPFNRFCAW